MTQPVASKKRLVPEVIQSSMMDCGPAALAALLQGMGIPTSYPRLREACQTDVDGTSIDVLEELACQLGLNAEQIVIPSDHLFMAGARATPSIVVVLSPGGLTHFVVVWNRVGPFVQVMDPAVGRVWMRASRLRDLLYQHQLEVSEADWLAFASSEDFTEPLRERMRQLKVSAAAAAALVQAVQTHPESLLQEAHAAPESLGQETHTGSDHRRQAVHPPSDTAAPPIRAFPGWLPLAVLDAATRLTGALRASGALPATTSAETLIRSLVSEVLAAPAERYTLIPQNFWCLTAVVTEPDPNAQPTPRPRSAETTPESPPDSEPGVSAASDSQSAPGKATDSQPAPTEAADSQPASTEASNSQPAPTEASNSQPAPTEASNSQPAPTEASNSQPAPTEASNSQSAPREASNSQPAPTEASNSQAASTEASSGTEPEATLTYRGAVVLAARGVRPEVAGDLEALLQQAGVSRDVILALSDTPITPERHFFQLLKADGLLAPMAVIVGFLMASAAMLVQVVLFKGLLELGWLLGSSEQRSLAMAIVIAFAVLMVVYQLPLLEQGVRLGRGMELRIRMAILEKIPRLGDRYFESRLISDMAERAHALHKVRTFAPQGGMFVRQLWEFLLTLGGLLWLDPGLWLPALLAAICLPGVPWLLSGEIGERDLRFKSHTGALSGSYLDALRGLSAIQAHGAEKAVRREHESRLTHWYEAGIRFNRAIAAQEVLISTIGLAFAAWMVVDHLSRVGATGTALLLMYWALNLLELARGLAAFSRSYPQLRSVMVRISELLTAPEEEGLAAEKVGAAAAFAGASAHPEPSSSTAAGSGAGASARPEPSSSTAAGSDAGASVCPEASSATGSLPPPVAIDLKQVSVMASGLPILQEITLQVQPGEHVAVVGPSGAGKSSLLALMLGWHRPIAGVLEVDGEPLETYGVQRLRQECAWVDPAVQLWNQSLLANIRYGNQGTSVFRVGDMVEAAELRGVLERLPEGFQSSLGEGGGLVSGGEGQRVRLARAMLRENARLVLLDEPFRGLDRGARRRLLRRARDLWQHSTLFCVTHDVGETTDFDRVLVIHGGRLVECDTPAALQADSSSLYVRLLEAEQRVRTGLWESDRWRRLVVADGVVRETFSTQEDGVVRETAGAQEDGLVGEALGTQEEADGTHSIP